MTMLSVIVLKYSKRIGLRKLARGGLQISRLRACQVAAIKARKCNDNKKLIVMLMLETGVIPRSRSLENQSG